MKDILTEIVAHKHIELKEQRERTPLRALAAQVEPLLSSPTPSMRAALTASPSGIIAEFKRRSPSKGWIKEDGRADIVPLAYAKNGAAALSILTDQRFFGGDDSFIVEARASGVELPILYKNFVVDEYQLLQARLCGASAVLLIAACLKKSECCTLLEAAHRLGLEVLLEMHSEEELEYAELEPDMCGINNRNLGTFVTKVDNSFRLAELLPRDACKVSESGISRPHTVRQLREAGFHGFLIGESFMKEDNPGAALAQFIGQI
jgi:indole-3-glycerol phosphate synthase